MLTAKCAINIWITGVIISHKHFGRRAFLLSLWALDERIATNLAAVHSYRAAEAAGDPLNKRLDENPKSFLEDP